MPPRIVGSQTSNPLSYIRKAKTRSEFEQFSCWENEFRIADIDQLGLNSSLNLALISNFKINLNFWNVNLFFRPRIHNRRIRSYILYEVGTQDHGDGRNNKVKYKELVLRHCDHFMQRKKALDVIHVCFKRLNTFNIVPRKLSTKMFLKEIYLI